MKGMSLQANEVVWERARGLWDDEVEGLSFKVDSIQHCLSIDGEMASDRFEVRGTIESGEKVGDWLYIWRPERVFLGDVWIDKSYRGGRVSKWVERCVERFEGAGIVEVGLTAIDPGAVYVWARLGFELSENVQSRQGRVRKALALAWGSVGYDPVFQGVWDEVKEGMGVVGLAKRGELGKQAILRIESPLDMKLELGCGKVGSSHHK